MRGTFQEQTDTNNKAFWNELCGTQLAKQLGVVDASVDSLAKFDNFYLDYYPYLKNYLMLDEIKNKKVLEVGLGYGTVSQQLALSGAHYYGLDIAEKVVAMASHRLTQHQLEGDVRMGSMLECPFPDNYFDYVISIGCFHHTGDMRRCVAETARVLKPGGKAQRKAYDASSDNKGAPETEFFSKKEIQQIFSTFQSVTVNCENFDDYFGIKIGKIPLFRLGKRLSYLESQWARKLGLDLYIQATK